jgi:DNA-binding response OmpR family regulator
MTTAADTPPVRVGDPVCGEAPSPPGRLGTTERAILGALVDAAGRVTSRRELSRRAGLTEQSERRCDAVLVTIRRVLGADSIRTVRGRGWMLVPERVEGARALLDDAR